MDGSREVRSNRDSGTSDQRVGPLLAPQFAAGDRNLNRGPTRAISPPRKSSSALRSNRRARGTPTTSTPSYPDNCAPTFMVFRPLTIVSRVRLPSAHTRLFCSSITNARPSRSTGGDRASPRGDKVRRRACRRSRFGSDAASRHWRQRRRQCGRSRIVGRTILPHPACMMLQAC